MANCVGCGWDTSPEDIFPYNNYGGGDNYNRIYSTTQVCSRCLAEKEPDAHHPRFRRTGVPDCIVDAFPDEATVNPEQCGLVNPTTGDLCRTKTIAGGRCYEHRQESEPDA